MIEDGCFGVVLHDIRLVYHIQAHIIHTNVIAPSLRPIDRQGNARILHLSLDQIHLPFDRNKRRRGLNDEVHNRTLFRTVRTILSDQIKRVEESIKGIWVTLIVGSAQRSLNDSIRARNSDGTSIPKETDWTQPHRSYLKSNPSLLLIFSTEFVILINRRVHLTTHLITDRFGITVISTVVVVEHFLQQRRCSISALGIRRR